MKETELGMLLRKKQEIIEKLLDSAYELAKIEKEIAAYEDSK